MFKSSYTFYRDGLKGFFFHLRHHLLLLRSLGREYSKEIQKFDLDVRDELFYSRYEMIAVVVAKTTVRTTFFYSSKLH